MGTKSSEGTNLKGTRKFLQNEYVKSAIVIAIIVAVVLGSFLALQLALGSPVPIRVVESGSMCIPYDGGCDGWSHPFSPTLHKGDIIIIQKVNPKDLISNYPDSNIIVYQNPTNPTDTPIVHRIVAVDEVNGTLYFQTKGDGNGVKYPALPSSSEYDSNSLWHTGEGVPQNLVIGKVIFRIPYFGWITLFLKGTPWGLPVIIILILVLIALEFVIPLIRHKLSKSGANTEQQQISNL
jgi:signal peptidase I